MTPLARFATLTALIALSATTFAQQKPSAIRQEATPATESKAELTTPPATAPANLALPMGTAVKMKLETILSTVANKAGDPFAGRVTEDVTMNGAVVIPVGSSIQGHVARVHGTRRYKGLPSLDLHPETVTTPAGQAY